VVAQLVAGAAAGFAFVAVNPDDKWPGQAEQNDGGQSPEGPVRTLDGRHQQLRFSWFT
jgi:hypothetical protein